MSDKKSVIISLLLGLGLSAGAGYMYSDARQLIATAEKSPGTVIGFERRSSKGGSSDYPVIEFATAAGEIRRFTTSGAGNYAKGQMVEVLYDAGNPDKARVNVFLELWLGSLILGAFGLFCLGIGIGTLLYERARLKTGTDDKPR
jgi:hypothetical protein